MIYKGERDVKLMVIDTEAENSYVRIKNDEDLIEVITDCLNSVDFDLVKNGAEIDVVDYIVINNNNSKSGGEYSGDIYYDKIHYFYYKIILKKIKKEI